MEADRSMSNLSAWPLNVTAADNNNNNSSNCSDSQPSDVSSAISSQAEMIEILRFQYYAWGVAGNIISGLGILGNVLSIVVLAHRRMRSSTAVYLIAQAAFDIVVLVSLILFMALPSIHYFTGRLEHYSHAYPYLHPFAYPLALIAQTCSIYTTVGFTIERYIAVCHPLKAARWCTQPKAHRAILLIVLASVIYNVPRMLEYRTDVYVDPVTNATRARYMYTEMGANKTFRHIYFIYMHISVMLLVPFAVLTVTNALLIRAVRQSRRANGKVNQKQHKENNLTVMLIAVVIVFLICQVPSIVDNIFMATLRDETLQSPPFVKLTCVSSLMVITNSAANFYLYCVFGNKFRQVFCRLFCSWCCYGSAGGGGGGGSGATGVPGVKSCYADHETSLLGRGGSAVGRVEKNGSGSGRMHDRGADRRSTSSSRGPTPVVYRYSKTSSGATSTTTVAGGAAAVGKASNGQQSGRYCSIQHEDVTNTTNV